MTTEQLLSMDHEGAANVVFDVDYSTIRKNKIIILNIVNAWDFKYKYDSEGNLLNFPINVAGTVWNAAEMYIYNS